MSQKSSHYTIAVLGNWHLSFCTGACLASLGHRVLFVNHDAASAWKEFPVPPVREPGLPEMIADARAKGLLDFANGFGSDWTADAVWMAIDTPVNERDEADTSPLLEAAEALKANRNTTGPLIVSSQIPMGFSAELQRRTGLQVAYVPENLRLGKGIETFLTADRTVVGSDLPETGEAVHRLLSGFKTEFFFCDLVTSEMVKHATNAFLATSISFANELARIGEQMGVDNMKVAQALKLDKRIGKAAYVAPGLGFAGGTLPRDLRVLQKFGETLHVPTPLVNSVLQVNESTASALEQVLSQAVAKSSGKGRVLILGYTYKAETDTLRRSSSLELAAALTAKGMEVQGYDPDMNSKDLTPLRGVIRHRAYWRDIDGPLDVCVVMTPRPAFADLDWKSLTGKPLVFDTRAIVPAEKVLGAGLSYKALWQPVRVRARGGQ
ncbi:MAG: nucleotide sugar dehydrogenase [Oligoflexia bacterium]|nr:nucleotide sugar dehydrogenase [Oligoflexia bacterium]